MNILNITIEPSSSNWWKQRQRHTSEHWTEPPKSSWRVEGMRIWAKRSRPWWVHPLKQSTWANGSSPTSAKLGRNKHRIKLVPLNVGDSCMAGADCGTTGPTACTGFLGTYSLWMDTLINPDIVEPWTFPKAMCLNLSEDGRGKVGGMWMEWEEGREWEFGLVCVMKGDSLFSFLNIEIKMVWGKCHRNIDGVG